MNSNLNLIPAQSFVPSAKQPDYAVVMDLMSSIRGVAALIVAAVHAFQIFVLPYFGLYGAAHLTTSFFAAYSVIAFFIVSGFMIFVSVAKHRDGDGCFDAIGFSRARIFRIYPPLIASVIASFAVFFIVKSLDLHGASSFRLGDELFLSRERVDFEWDRLLPTLLLIYNVFPHTTPPLSVNGPLWTLAFEWWFYIFAMACAGLRSRHSFWLGWLPLGVLLFVFFNQPSGILFWVFFVVWHAGFFMGYLYLRGGLHSNQFLRNSILLLLFFVLCIVAVGEGQPIKYLIEPLQRLGKRAHVVMMFAALILTVALATAIRCKLRGRLLVSTARYSYTLYVLHFPLLIFAFSLLHPIVYKMGWIASCLAGFFSLFITIYVSARLAKIVEDRDLIIGFIASRRKNGSIAKCKATSP
ncbi:MAG: acyltransferase [Rhodocyclales bacterium]|nr:acyltransferase [Rhodocyclales bacterium]